MGEEANRESAKEALGVARKVGDGMMTAMERDKGGGLTMASYSNLCNGIYIWTGLLSTRTNGNTLALTNRNCCCPGCLSDNHLGNDSRNWQAASSSLRYGSQRRA